MTHPSKRKGNDFERELVNTAVASGIEAKRAYGSNGEALGEHAEVDCLIGGQRVQAKRRRAIAGYMLPTEHVDAVAMRPNYGETVVVIRYSDWLELVKAQANVDTTSQTLHNSGCVD